MSTLRYKLKNNETGLFYAGSNVWSKEGKLWTNPGHIRSSITNINNEVKSINHARKEYNQRMNVDSPMKPFPDFSNCEIIVFDLVEIKTIPL